MQNSSKAVFLVALLTLVPSTRAFDELALKPATRLRGTVIALRGSSLTISDDATKNTERELVLSPIATIAWQSDDSGKPVDCPITQITPNQGVILGVAVDGATVVSVTILGETLTGTIKELTQTKITLATGTADAPKSLVIPLWEKTEYRVPDLVEGKRTTRDATFKELEAGQSVSIRMSPQERTKARVVTVTRQPRRIAATMPTTSPATAPAVSAPPASPDKPQSP